MSLYVVQGKSVPVWPAEAHPAGCKPSRFLRQREETISVTRHTTPTTFTSRRRRDATTPRRAYPPISKTTLNPLTKQWFVRARSVGNCRGVPGLRLCGEHRHFRPRQRQREGERWDGGGGGRQDFFAAVFRHGRAGFLCGSVGRLKVNGRACPADFRKQRVRQNIIEAGRPAS